MNIRDSISLSMKAKEIGRIITRYGEFTALKETTWKGSRIK